MIFGTDKIFDKTSFVTEKLFLVSLMSTFLHTLIYLVPFLIIGVGESSDHFYAALAFSQVLFAVIYGSVLTTLIPIFTQKKSDTQSRVGICNGVAILVASVSFIFLMCLCSGLSGLVELTFGFYSEADKTLISSLAKTSLIGTFFAVLGAVYSAWFYSVNKPLLLEFVGAISSVLAVSYMFYFTAYDADNLLLHIVWALNLKWIFYFLFSYFFQDKPISIKFLKPKEIKLFVFRVRYLLGGAIFYKTDIVFDRHFSSQTNPGDLTILFLLHQMFTVVGNVSYKSITLPSSSRMSAHYVDKNNDGFFEEFKCALKKLGVTFFIAMAIMMLCYLAATYIGLIESVLNISSRTLLIYALCLIGVLAGSIFAPLFSARFYAIGDTSLPTRIGVFGFILGIVFKIAGFALFGFEGLLIGISLYYLLNTALLNFGFPNQLKASNYD